MKVDIEHIKYLKSELYKINKVPFSSLEFYEKGKRIVVPNQLIRDFDSVGLNNTDFITTGFYKDGFVEVEK